MIDVAHPALCADARPYLRIRTDRLRINERDRPLVHLRRNTGHALPVGSSRDRGDTQRECE